MFGGNTVSPAVSGIKSWWAKALCINVHICVFIHAHTHIHTHICICMYVCRCLLPGGLKDSVRRNWGCSGTLTASSSSNAPTMAQTTAEVGAPLEKFLGKKLVNTVKNEQQGRKWRRCSMGGQCIPWRNCWPWRALMWADVRVAWQEGENYWKNEEENVFWKYWQRYWGLGTWEPGLGARSTLENFSCPLQSAPRVCRNLCYPEMPLRRANTTVMATYCLRRWETA